MDPVLKKCTLFTQHINYNYLAFLKKIFILGTCVYDYESSLSISFIFSSFKTK